MAEHVILVDDAIVERGRKFRFVVFAELDDEAGTIDVGMKLTDAESGRVTAHVRVKAQITNPLEIVAGYLLQAAGHYGMCVGVKLLYGAGAICYESYNESATEKKEMTWKERCKDVFSRLKGKSSEAKKYAKEALTDCIDAGLSALS